MYCPFRNENCDTYILLNSAGCFRSAWVAWCAASAALGSNTRGDSPGLSERRRRLRAPGDSPVSRRCRSTVRDAPSGRVSVRSSPEVPLAPLAERSVSPRLSERSERRKWARRDWNPQPDGPGLRPRVAGPFRTASGRRINPVLTTSFPDAELLAARRCRSAPLAVLRREELDGLAGTERTPEAFARVGESTNDWSERSERKEVNGLAGI